MSDKKKKDRRPKSLGEPLIPFGHPCNLASTPAELRAFSIKYGKEPWFPVVRVVSA